MCFDYDGYSDVYEESRPRARKPHKCGECRGPIQPGEQYHLIRSLYEGRWSNFKECQRCEHVRELVQRVEESRGCEGDEAICPFMELHDAIGEDRTGYGLFHWDEDADEYYVLPVAAHLFRDARVVETLPTGAIS